MAFDDGYKVASDNTGLLKPIVKQKSLKPTSKMTPLGPPNCIKHYPLQLTLSLHPLDPSTSSNRLQPSPITTSPHLTHVQDETCIKTTLSQAFDTFWPSERFPSNTRQWPFLLSTVHQS